MKLNEKNLAAFAASSSPIDKEGFLVKRGELNKAFQRRWFILKGNLLFYYEKKGDKEPTGVVILEGCTVELADDEGQFAFKIVFHGLGNRTYTLEAETQDSMESWMKAIACSSYDYMKLMVEEMQRQLDEIQATKKEVPKEAQETTPPVPPPRVRHNPFNRDKPSSISVSTPRRPQHRELNVSQGGGYRHRMTFREVHTAFGRRILKDLNEWRHQQRLLNQPLIQL